MPFVDWFSLPKPPRTVFANSSIFQSIWSIRLNGVTVAEDGCSKHTHIYHDETTFFANGHDKHMNEQTVSTGDLVPLFTVKMQSISKFPNDILLCSERFSYNIHIYSQIVNLCVISLLSRRSGFRALLVSTPPTSAARRGLT